MIKIFDEQGIEAELITIGQKDIRGCIGGMVCKNGKGQCVFDDIVNETAKNKKNVMVLWLVHQFIMALLIQR